MVKEDCQERRWQNQKHWIIYAPVNHLERSSRSLTERLRLLRRTVLKDPFMSNRSGKIGTRKTRNLYLSRHSLVELGFRSYYTVLTKQHKKDRLEWARLHVLLDGGWLGIVLFGPMSPDLTVKGNDGGARVIRERLLLSIGLMASESLRNNFIIRIRAIWIDTFVWHSDTYVKH